jgi:hypothetical protein
MIYDMTASVSAAAIRHVLVQSTGCLIINQCWDSDVHSLTHTHRP